MRRTLLALAFLGLSAPVQAGLFNRRPRPRPVPAPAPQLVVPMPRPVLVMPAQVVARPACSGGNCTAR